MKIDGGNVKNDYTKPLTHEELEEARNNQFLLP